MSEQEKRPKSAKYNQKEDGLENNFIEEEKERYKLLNKKHQEHRKEIKNNIQPLTQKDFINSGVFHKVYRVGEKTVVFEDIDKNKQEMTYLNIFNNAFIPSLLEVCGEKTIPVGVMADGKQYTKFAASDLFNYYELILNSDAEDEKKQEYEEDFIMVLFGLAGIMSTVPGRILELEDREQINKYFQLAVESYDRIEITKQKYAIDFASRLLFKALLFQMFDRKVDNILLLKERNENGLPIIVESDFDDFKYISSIFFKIKTDDKEFKQMLYDIINDVVYLYKCHKNNYVGGKYSVFFSDLERRCCEIAEQYTMTKEKMAKLIEGTTMKAKYLGLKEDEIITNIKSKMQDWKDMLNNKDTKDIVEQFDFIKKAREDTRKTFQEIEKETGGMNDFIERIVKGTKVFQDIAIKENNYKDTNDFIQTNDAKREKIETELKQKIIQKKENIEQLKSFINNGTEIKQDNITADSIINYLKQEQDKSRSFWWVFGQRNKRFNALCNSLEQLGVQQPERLFTNKDKEQEDETTINKLFEKDDKQPDNKMPQRNIQTIFNRLEQVSCGSCS